MHQHKRELAYARLIVALVCDDMKGEERDRTVDYLASRMGLDPCIHPGLFTPPCRAPGLCNDIRSDVHCEVCSGNAYLYCGECDREVTVRDL